MKTYHYFAKVLASLLGNETAVCLTMNGLCPCPWKTSDNRPTVIA